MVSLPVLSNNGSNASSPLSSSEIIPVPDRFVVTLLITDFDNLFDHITDYDTHDDLPKYLIDYFNMRVTDKETNKTYDLIRLLMKLEDYLEDKVIECEEKITEQKQKDEDEDILKSMIKEKDDYQDFRNELDYIHNKFSTVIFENISCGDWSDDDTLQIINVKSIALNQMFLNLFDFDNRTDLVNPTFIDDFLVEDIEDDDEEETDEDGFQVLPQEINEDAQPVEDDNKSTSEDPSTESEDEICMCCGCDLEDCDCCDYCGFLNCLCDEKLIKEIKALKAELEGKENRIFKLEDTLKSRVKRVAYLENKIEDMEQQEKETKDKIYNLDLKVRAKEKQIGYLEHKIEDLEELEKGAKEIINGYKETEKELTEELKNLSEAYTRMQQRLKKLTK